MCCADQLNPQPSAAVRGSELPAPKLPLSSAKTKALIRQRLLTQTAAGAVRIGAPRRSARPCSPRDGALGLLRSHHAHGHAEPLDAVGQVETQPPGDPLWQCRDDDLVVLLALERLAYGLVRVGGSDNTLHMRARGRVE